MDSDASSQAYCFDLEKHGNQRSGKHLKKTAASLLGPVIRPFDTDGGFKFTRITLSQFHLQAHQVDEISLSFAKQLQLLLLQDARIDQLPTHSRQKKAYQSGLFLDSCIIDNSILGQPVQFRSRNFQLSASSFKIGDCIFANFMQNLRREMSFKGSTSTLLGRTLRVEIGFDKRPRLVLTFQGQLYSATDGRTRSSLAWVSSLDVTAILSKVAVANYLHLALGREVEVTSATAEFVQTSKINTLPAYGYERAVTEEVCGDDWFLNLDTKVISSISGNDQIQPNFQAALSLIAQLEQHYSAVLIFCVKPSTFEQSSIWYISSGCLADFSGSIEALRHSVASQWKVLRTLMDGSREKVGKVDWGSQNCRRTMLSVPLKDGCDAHGQTATRAWACFVTTKFDKKQRRKRRVMLKV